MVLKAYWPLDEETGSTAYDVRNGNDGELNGPEIGAESFLGSTVYRFNGDGDEVGLPDFSFGEIFNGSNSHSVAAWVYTGDSLSGTQRILHPRAHNDIALMLSGGALAYSWYDGSNGASASYSVETNTWYHVTAVWSMEDNNVKLYVNGQLRDSTSQEAAGNPDIQGQSNTIGSRSDNTQDWYEGKLSEIRVYDHALTRSEIQYLYQVGKRGLHVSDSRTL